MSHVCTLMIEKVKCPCCSFLDTRNLNFLNLSLESALLYVYIYTFCSTFRNLTNLYLVHFSLENSTLENFPVLFLKKTALCIAALFLDM